MKFNNILLFATFASILSTAAYANPVTITTQDYVDAALGTKQDQIRSYDPGNDELQSVLTDTVRTGVVGKRAIMDMATYNEAWNWGDLVDPELSRMIPDAGTVGSALAEIYDEIDVSNLQTKIPARQTKINNLDTTYSPSVVTNGATDGTIGQMAIITGARMDDDDLAWDDYSNNDSLIPTFGAVGHELDRIQANIPSVTPLTWNNTTDTAAVNNYSTTFNGTTNNWPTAQSTQYVRGNAFASGLALKQNKIPASEWEDGHSNTIPGVVVSTDTDGVVEQRMVLEDGEANEQSIDYVVDMGYDNGAQGTISSDMNVSANDVNNAIPTTTMTIAIAKSAVTQTAIPLTWNSTTDTAAVNNYSTTFNGTTNNWPTNQSTQYVRGNAFAKGLALKQNKIPARQTKIDNSDTTYAPSVVTNGTTDGTVGQMAILTDEYLGDQGDTGTEFEDYSDNVIPTAAAVSAELKRKQKKLGGTAVQAGKVVTATATAGNVTYTAIDGTVTNASSNLVTSGAVYTAVSTKQNQMTCTRWLNNIETDENCLLWSIE